ncbi:hypothetical protein PMI05_04253 [Brevibacillus sp. BC25]|nr:hypothetical protein PMI05_04253 [Brevibacillus sp. BC25]
MDWTGGIVDVSRFPFTEEGGFFVLGDQSRLLGGLHSVVMKE